MYLVCCCCTGALAARQMCSYCRAGLLCIVHNIVARWNNKERLQALHCITLCSRSCKGTVTTYTSLSSLISWSWALHSCSEQNAASVMTVVMQKCRVITNQSTTNPDRTSEGCNPMKLETMSSFTKLPVLYVHRHIQNLTSPCKPLQLRPLMTHKDYVRVHSCTLLSTSASQTIAPD